MRDSCSLRATAFLILTLAASSLAPDRTQAQDSAAAPTAGALLLSREGTVDYRRGETGWNDAAEGTFFQFRDRVRTGDSSRAAIRLSNQAVLRMSELSSMEILPPKDSSTKPQVSFFAGLMYFFSREQPREIQIQTPTATGALRGTEFALSVAANGTTVISMIDGQVDLANDKGTVTVGPGEQGTVEPGKAPVKTAMIEAKNIIQWFLYYPGTVNPNELSLSGKDGDKLGTVLEAYRSGDMVKAKELWPSGYSPVSQNGRILRAATLLTVGQVDEALSLVKGIQSSAGGEAEFQQLIAAVRNDKYARAGVPESAAAWLTESYYQQSQLNLEAAREAAWKATNKDPKFGFAWVRVAEMEFSFGQTDKALKALEQASELSPKNAQALALEGFMLAGINRNDKAAAKFDEAIAIDSGLGNAWLGRGLVKIRTGHGVEGRQDLQTAALLEPNRSLLRSYLGKAQSADSTEGKHGNVNAKKELDLAKRLDPADPTPWLYSALLNKQENKYNAAIRDLEKSIDLNDNRRLYRSRLLLDQDRAVRNANLASIYRDAGLLDVSVKEASKAVTADYGNYSSHLFLANSYDAMRDPREVQLRYETPWFNSLLLANLLSPVGAGSLSQNVSQQEYSRLFDGDKLFGFSSSSEYYSDGEFRQTASYYGNYKNSAWAFDTKYFFDDGHRPHNKYENLESTFTLKQQITRKDSLFFQAQLKDISTDDVLQYYNNDKRNRITNKPADAADRGYSSSYQQSEEQEPNILFGWHREWAPGQHTLAMFSRLSDQQHFQQKDLLFPFYVRNEDHGLEGIGVVPTAPMSYSYDSGLEVYSGELQHIWQTDRHTTIVGTRIQQGEFNTQFKLDNQNRAADFLFRDPVVKQDESVDFERYTAYAYHTWQALDNLWLTAGLTYDYLNYPDNYRNPPINDTNDNIERFSPKFGITWNPWKDTTVRAAYTRSVGGVSYDQSVRLEPLQVAGFNQSFRNIMPESLIGSVGGATFETWNVGIDQKITKTGTYFGVEGEILKSAVTRDEGLLNLGRNKDGSFDLPMGHDQIQTEFGYEETSLTAWLNQLIGEEWSLGARYKATISELDTKYPQTADRILHDSERSGTLQQLNLYAIYNHSSGFFAKLEGNYNRQDNFGYEDDSSGLDPLESEQFWQLNSYIGYRMPKQAGEVTLGLLNMTDDDYKLNPINPYQETPRERTVYARVKLNF